jgi:hypothetical protein
MGSNANEKKYHKHNMPRGFSDAVDWSAILIDLWEAPGWLMSELGPDCVKTRMLRFAGAAGWLMKSSLCSDRFY